jgi:hypothetical protein
MVALLIQTFCFAKKNEGKKGRSKTRASTFFDWTSVIPKILPPKFT